MANATVKDNPTPTDRRTGGDVNKNGEVTREKESIPGHVPHTVDAVDALSTGAAQQRRSWSEDPHLIKNKGRLEMRSAEVANAQTQVTSFAASPKSHLRPLHDRSKKFCSPRRSKNRSHHSSA
jgi:hypothetical protein